jgi:hypothetical protein
VTVALLIVAAAGCVLLGAWLERGRHYLQHRAPMGNGRRQ